VKNLRCRTCVLIVLLIGIVGLLLGFTWRENNHAVEVSGVVKLDTITIGAEPLPLLISKLTQKESASPYVSSISGLSTREEMLKDIPLLTVKEIFVKPGERVTAGQKLLELDDGLYVLQAKQADALINLVKSSLNLIDSKLEELKDMQGETKSAETKLGDALRQMEQKKAEMEKQISVEVTQLQGQYEQAAIVYKQALASLKAAKVTGDETQIAQAQAQVDACVQALAQLEAGMAQMQAEIEQGEKTYQAQKQKVEEGLRQVKKAQAQVVEVLKELKGQKRIIEARLDQTKVALHVAQAELRKTTIKALKDGTVLNCNVQKGELVYPGMPLIACGDFDKVHVKAYMLLKQAVLVKNGQEAEVQVDSYPNRIFKGKVSRITSYTQFTPSATHVKGQRTTRVVVIIVSVDNVDGIFKSGMAADISIKI